MNKSELAEYFEGRVYKIRFSDFWGNSDNGRTKIDVMVEAETLWLKKQLTELFGN